VESVTAPAEHAWNIRPRRACSRNQKRWDI
jgi:hypothetical protein